MRVLFTSNQTPNNFLAGFLVMIFLFPLRTILYVVSLSTIPRFRRFLTFRNMLQMVSLSMIAPSNCRFHRIKENVAKVMHKLEGEHCELFQAHCPKKVTTLGYYLKQESIIQLITS